jgi:hypothetical protein
MDHYYIVEVEYQGVSEHMFMTAINGSEARRFAKEKFRKERSISTQSYVEAKIIAESNDVEEISSYFTLLTDPPNKITAQFEVKSYKSETHGKMYGVPDSLSEHLFGMAVNRSCNEELKATRRVLASLVRQCGGFVRLGKEVFDWSEQDQIMHLTVDPVTLDLLLELKEKPNEVQTND